MQTPARSAAGAAAYTVKHLVSGIERRRVVRTWRRGRLRDGADGDRKMKGKASVTVERDMQR